LFPAVNRVSKWTSSEEPSKGGRAIMDEAAQLDKDDRDALVLHYLHNNNITELRWSARVGRARSASNELE
jgi:hypothetical protein